MKRKSVEMVRELRRCAGWFGLWWAQAGPRGLGRFDQAKRCAHVHSVKQKIPSYSPVSTNTQHSNGDI